MRTVLNNPPWTDFLQIELKLAFTYCRLAKLPNGHDNSRCVCNARSAYDAAIRFSPRVGMSDKEFGTFTANAERVRLMLEDLETRVLESRLGVVL